MSGTVQNEKTFVTLVIYIYIYRTENVLNYS